MPRRLHSSTLETRTARLKLPKSSKPVYAKIGKGLGLGYRRTSTAGSWVARVANGKGGNRIKNIGIADDYADADGNSVLDFWQAQEAARAVTSVNEKPRRADDDKLTIAEVVDRYERHLKTRAGDLGNVARVRVHLGELATKLVAELEADDFETWRSGLTLAPASIDRTASVLKAALNLAAKRTKSEAVKANRDAWRDGLACIADVQESRNVVVEQLAIRKILAEAYNENPEFGLLVEVAAVTGSRVSQLFRLTVENLRSNPPRLEVPVSRKGRGRKKVTHRIVHIGDGLFGRLKNAASVGTVHRIKREMTA